MGAVGLWSIEGLEDLYRKHAPTTIRVAFLITGDRALAEDLTQEAFIRAVGRLAHVRDRAAFGGYLRTTGVNLAKMHFRRREIERRHEPPLQSAPTMENVTADAEAIRNALQDLTYRQRVAIVLRYYLDLPDPEIAAELGCSEGTVRSLISRGTTRMKEIMEVDRDA